MAKDNRNKKLNKENRSRRNKKPFVLKKEMVIRIWIIAFILLIICFIFMQKNKRMVKNYNFGVSALRVYDFDEAEYRFSQALYYKPSRFRECRVRLNYALSITSRITPTSVTYENLDESIEELLRARSILVENGCAHDSDTKGHSKKAEKLKAEIDDYIEWLKENNPPPPPPEKQDEKENDNTDDKDNNGGGNDNDKEQEAKEQELKEQEAKEQELRNLIESAEEIGQKERFTHQEWAENMQVFSSYSGKSW